MTVKMTMYVSKYGFDRAVESRTDETRGAREGS